MICSSLILLLSFQIPAPTTQSIQQPAPVSGETHPVVHLKLLPAEAWEISDELTYPPYPPLAHAAHIQGDIVVLLIVGQDGKVLKANAIKGAPQLRATAESYLSHFKYKIKPDHGEGPWAISITVRFNLKDGIGLAATDKEITMHKVPVGALRLP